MSTHPPATSWMQRNWKWAVPLIAAASLALVIGLAGTLLFSLRSMIQSSEPYQVALREATRHPAVIEALGEPLTAGFLPQGKLSTAGDTGTARLSFSLHGPRGQATVELDASRKADRWSYRRLQVDLPGAAGRVDLLPIDAADN